MKSKENKLLDFFKFISALMVLTSHCLPFIPNDDVNFYYGQWLFRFCVPLFLISSGYYFASFEETKKIKYIVRIALLYMVSSCIYLPLYVNGGMKQIIFNIIFGYHHLWYLSALIISLCMVLLIERIPFINNVFHKVYLVLAIALVLFGAYYDEYQHVFSRVVEIPLLNQIGAYINYIGGSRHALFFAFPMLLIGKFIYEHPRITALPKASCISLIGISFACSFFECMMLQRLIGRAITCDITIFNFVPAIFLIVLTLIWQPKGLQNISTKFMRKTADIVYVIHILVLLLVDRLFGVTYMLRLIVVLMITLIIAVLYVKTTDLLTSKN